MAKQQTAKKAKVEPLVVGKIEVLDAEGPTVALVDTDAVSQVKQFIGNIITFVKGAGELEVKAKDTLAAAKRLQAPTDIESDARVQTFIRTVTADKKKVEDYWGITQVIHSVHRKLTAKRGIATQALDDAGVIAQRLHNTYAEAERRRAAAEQDRVRREAEERARQERERELAEAEQRAVDLELASENLSERERFFVERIVEFNQPANIAAMNAGFKNPDKVGYQLLERPKIKAAIAAAREAKSIREQVAAKRDEPLEVEVEEIKPEISKGGGYDRATHGAECLDVDQLRLAVISGKYGIPHDVLTVDQVKLNEYGRSLQELVNRWPGVRHTKKTKTV